MTGDLFAATAEAKHYWDFQEIVLPTQQEWIEMGGSLEVYRLRATALKSAQRFIKDLKKELHPPEQDQLFEALFYDAIEVRTTKLKDGAYPEIVARYIRRHDGGRYNAAVRDYIAQMTGN